MPTVRTTVLAALSLLAVAAMPATAQPDSASGRYSIAPSGDGFMRLDTRSGTVSHCRKESDEDGSSWVCAPAADAEAAMRAEIADLRARVEALERRVNGTGPAPASSPPDEAEMERVFSFAERLMGRFFAMVEEMKRSDDSR